MSVSGGDRNQVGQEYVVSQSSVSVSVEEVAFRSAVVSDINLLKRDVKDIHRDSETEERGYLFRAAYFYRNLLFVCESDKP